MQKMKLLYINYWSLGNPLTETTVFPNLNILKPYFSEITLTTVEREFRGNISPPSGIKHIAFNSATYMPRFLCKIYDLVFYFTMLLLLTKRDKPGLIICRGSMAAIFGLFVSRLCKVPFMVESFEPHAEYMAEGGTWSRTSLSYKFQSWVENEVIRDASCLMPVSNKYKNHLIGLGVNAERLNVLPCCVDLSKFAFNENNRKRVRLEMEVSESTVVGIYVGKFGDLYLEDEAFEIFRRTKEFFNNNFHLVILTPQSKSAVENRLIEIGFLKRSIIVDMVEHAKVPDFLSASDFAFSLVRSSLCSQFCSPVKNGEYWANGLPIILPKNIGDDETIILETKSGVVFDPFDLSTFPQALECILKITSTERNIVAAQIARVAHRFRNFSIIENEYKKVLTKFGLAGYRYQQ